MLRALAASISANILRPLRGYSDTDRMTGSGGGENNEDRGARYLAR